MKSMKLTEINSYDIDHDWSEYQRRIKSGQNHYRDTIVPD